jgi:hypothetical protein
MRDIPNSACAYLAAFDILRGAEELTDLEIELRDNPTITSILRRRDFRNCTVTYKQAIDETTRLAKENLGLNLIEKEDPWIVLQSLREYLKGFSPTTNYMPLL